MILVTKEKKQDMLCHENPSERWVVQLQRDGYYEQMGMEIRRGQGRNSTLQLPSSRLITKLCIDSMSFFYSVFHLVPFKAAGMDPQLNLKNIKPGGIEEAIPVHPEHRG